jgi:hypothetical protein
MLGDSVNTRIEIGGMHTFVEEQYPLEVRNSFCNSQLGRREYGYGFGKSCMRTNTMLYSLINTGGYIESQGYFIF